MKFNRHSAEEVCGLPIAKPLKSDHTFMAACLRTKDHPGACEATARDAGAADGVRFCCRVPLADPHTDWCVIAKIKAP